MAEAGSTKIQVTVEGLDKLRARLGEVRPTVMERVAAQVAAKSKLWHRKCQCSCRCAIMHPGRKVDCVLCQGGDHWFSLSDYLAKIEARAARRNA